MGDTIHAAFEQLKSAFELAQHAVNTHKDVMSTTEQIYGADSIEYTHTRVKQYYLEAALHAIDNALLATSDACGDTNYVRRIASVQKDPTAI